MKTLPSGNVSQSTAANRSTSFYGRWVSPVGSVIRTLIDRAATACGDVGDPNDRQIVAIGEPHRLLGLRRRGRILDRYDS